MFAEQAVQAGDADVVEAIDRVAHQLRGDRRFLGDGQIGRAGARDQHGADAGWNLALLASVIARASSWYVAVGHDGAHGVERLRRRARHEQRLSARDDALGDGGDLGRSLA